MSERYSDLSLCLSKHLAGRLFPSELAKLEKELEAYYDEAMRAQQNSQVFIQNILKNIPDPVWLKNAEGVYLACNESFEHFFGAREAEIIGKTDYDFVEKEQADFFREHDRRAMASETPLSNEEWITFADGGRHARLLTMKTRLRNAEHELIGILGISRDITTLYEAKEALQERSAQLLEAQKIATLGYYRLDIRSGIWKSSELLDTIFGIDTGYPRDISGWLELLHPEWRETMQRYLEEDVIGKKLPFDKEYPIIQQNTGEVKWVYGRGNLSYDDAGDPLEMFGIIQDVSERKRLEAKQQLAVSVFSNAREGIIITDTDNRIVEVNQAFTDISSYAYDEVIGRDPSILKSGQHTEAFYQALFEELHENGVWSGELWNRKKSGALYAVLMTISLIRDESGAIRNYLALFSDITRQKTYEQELEHVAHYDALTGLPNRVLLTDRLQQAMYQARRRNLMIAIVYLDLDGFKAINDTHGHDVGDRLLGHIATQLRQSLRNGDTVGRIGGDEFVAILIDLKPEEQINELLERMLEAAAAPAEIDGHMLQVSASLGVTFYSHEADMDADQLMRQADQAMYQAKLTGKNRFHLFDAEYDRKLRGKHELMSQISEAIRNEAFELYYQPKVNLRSGEIIGFEALIRWHHPEKGLLLPGAFLPLIEEQPLAVELGAWVLESALTQLQRWKRAGYKWSVSINIGARQLQQEDFASELRRLLKSCPDVKPDSVTLEILESSALSDMQQVMHTMKECADMGISFALDDFGTGYSSLTYLKRLPVHELKIDRSFVMDMHDDPEDLSIMIGILGLADAFHLVPVAEGVETIEDGIMLLQLGCELAQGFGISRPMPVDMLEIWCREWKPNPKWRRQPPLGSEFHRIISTKVEYAAWIRKIVTYLRAPVQEMPSIERHANDFSVWLSQIRQIPTADRAVLETIGALHEAIHAYAQKLTGRVGRGESERMEAGIERLLQMRDALLGELDNLLGSIRSFSL